MTKQEVNFYTIDELKKVNKDAFYKVLEKAKTRLEQLVIDEFRHWYQELIRVLEDNKYFITDIEYSSYLTITYKGDKKHNPFYVLEDIKNNIDIDNFPGFYIKDYLINCFLDKNKNNDAVDYLTELFEFLFNKEYFEIDKIDENDIIDFIKCNNKLFTFNGFNKDLL